MTKRGFGELELAILHIMKSGEKKTVKEVRELLGSQDKYTTIMTVMLRLAQKGTLVRDRMGAHYEYWLATPSKVPSFIEQIKKKIFGVKPIELISYLIDSPNEISDDDLLEMEKMLEIAKIKRKK